MNRNIRNYAFWTTLSLATLSACTPTARQPTASTPALNREQSQTAIREFIYSQPAIFERVQYNPQPSESIDGLIDKTVSECISLRNFGKWPEDESSLKSFAGNIVGSVWRKVLQDETGKDAIESKLSQYWNSPTAKEDPNYHSVEIDLGVVPGKIEEDSKGVYTIRESEFVERLELKPSELVRRLKQLLTDYPNCKRYRIIVVTTPSYREHHPITYEYDRDSDKLTLHKRPTFFRSPEPIGGLDRLVSGEAPSHSSQLSVLKSAPVGSRN